MQTIRQQKLFHAIFAQISRQGWTTRAFESGVKSSAISVAEARKYFPRGIEDVVAAFYDLISAGMADAIQSNRKFVALRVRDKIAFCVRARLQAIENHQQAMRRLLAWSLLPQNMRGAAQALWQAADEIWIAAGDSSTDYNRYTKRLLLIAVMKATLSFWLNDASKDHADTWAFLDRRISDVLAVGKGISVIKTVGISDIASFLRSRFAA